MADTLDRFVKTGAKTIAFLESTPEFGAHVAAFSLSAGVSVWPNPTPHKSSSVQKFTAVFLMVASPGFNRESKDSEDYKHVTCEMQVK
jgi:hypothetical protein